MFEPEIIKKPTGALPSVLLGALLLAAAAPALGAANSPPWTAGKSKTIDADCAEDGALASAVARAGPGDRIMVTGTCAEQVVLTTSHVTVEGDGAVLDGSGVPSTGLAGVLTVRGAQGVTIRGVSVQGSAGSGIAVLGGSSVHIVDSTLDGNPGIGLLVQQSSVTVEDTSFSGNYIGADVIDSSSLILGGEITASGNALDNLSIAGASTVELRGAQVLLSNAFSGLTLLAGSRVVHWAFAPSAGNSLTLADNVIGLALVNSEVAVYTPDAVITATGNQAAGIYAAGGKVSCGFGYGSIDLQGNGVGLQLTENASAMMACNLNITGNGIGLNADGAGTLTLGPWDGTPPSAYTQTLQGNAVADVALQFGTRSQIIGATVGVVSCDPTVLSRGTTTCP